MNILLIGCGAVAKAVFELWRIESIKVQNLTIIEPKEIPEWCYEIVPHLQHIKTGLTKSNTRRILTPLLRVLPKPFVLDLSVDVDCIKVMKLCAEFGCNYLNTSLEDWSTKKPQILKKGRSALIKRSLVFRENQAEKILKKSKTTILTNNGQNPGMCNLYALQGIIDYTKKYGTEEQIQLCEKLEFGKLARSLELEEIHCAEIDTQTLKKGVIRPKGAFFNTWSCHGLISESLDPVQIGLGSNRKKVPNTLGVIPAKRATQSVVDYDNVRIYPVRGMDMYGDSKTLNDRGEIIRIEGRLIPHAETTTLNAFLTDGDYSPTVFYCYKVSKPTEDSYIDMIKNKYVPPEDTHVLNLNEVAEDGYDSVCMILYFRNGKEWIVGSVLNNKRVKEYGFQHSTCTTVQVATGVWAGLQWVQSHKNEGYNEPEDLFSSFVLKRAKKYLGDFYSKEV